MMDRDILVLVVVSVDYKEGSLQFRGRTKLEHLRQLRIRSGMSNKMGESVAYFIEVFQRVLLAVE